MWWLFKKLEKICPLIILYIIINIIIIEIEASFSVSKSLLKVSMPVWSLSTINNIDYSTNMNIVTYSNQISIKPEIFWGISLYKNTLSHENFNRNGWGVLQLLTNSHINTIPLLGKSSGYTVNKMKLLKDIGHQLSSFDVNNKEFNIIKDEFKNIERLSLFPNCPAIYVLKKVPSNNGMDMGDHDLFICQVVSIFSGTNRDDNYDNILTTDILRSNGII